MKTKLLLLLGISSFLFSCNEDVESLIAKNNDTRLKLVEVTTDGVIMPYDKTRSNVESGQLAIQFNSVQHFNATINKLEYMTPDERIELTDEIGFTSLEKLLQEADNELDEILEKSANNELEFKKVYDTYKAKYRNIFVFNPIDQYDVSPYIPALSDNSDIVAHLIGKNKCVVLKDKVVSIKMEDKMRENDYMLFADNNHLEVIEDESSNITPTRASVYDNAPLNGFVRKDGKMKYIVRFYCEEKYGMVTNTIKVHLGVQKKKSFYWARGKSDLFLKVNSLSNVLFNTGTNPGFPEPLPCYDQYGVETRDFYLAAKSSTNMCYGTAMLWPGYRVNKDRFGKYETESVYYIGGWVTSIKLNQENGWPIKLTL